MAAKKNCQEKKPVKKSGKPGDIVINPDQTIPKKSEVLVAEAEGSLGLIRILSRVNEMDLSQKDLATALLEAAEAEASSSDPRN